MSADLAPVDPAAVVERAERVRERIARAGGDGVSIVAVTKGFAVDALTAALAAGLDTVGESYAQECVAKLAALDPVAPRPAVHFIGRLQRNKVRRLAGLVDVWQSVDRPELAVEIGRRAPGARVLVQVDISGEATKGGCAPGEATALVDRCRAEDLEVLGLMGIAGNGPPEAAGPEFELLRGLVDDLGLRECSMGMSNDLEVAVAAGATMVRVGRELFGERPQ